jgi:TolB-like protein/predicted Zn-dependent protease
MNPGNFFVELKRRNVYRAAVAYGVVAWFLTQLTTQVFPFFDISNAAIRFVVMALAVGFPIAMCLSWLYEFTPEGIVRSEDLGPAEVRSARRATGRLLDFIIIGVLLLVIAMLAYQRFSFRPEAVEKIPLKSIAVLPFVNLSSDKENAFFTDGMQDEVLTDLSHIADLKVISRSSVMQYKDSATRNLHEIAAQLGVAYLLEASVQRAAGKVRVIAQLIDARSDTHVWAKTYDRPLEDIFAVQSEIAQTIAQQLHAQISPQARAAIEEKPTTNLVAYDLYLRAKQLLDNISTSTDWEGDNRRAVELLDRAVTDDPNFALAYCLLYHWNLNLYDWVDRTPARLARAQAALKEATRTAPEAGETYFAQSTEYKRIGDLDRAAELIEKAAKALPGNSQILLGIALVERRRGHWSEAVRYWEKARELDPKSPNFPNGLEDLYLSLRDYKKADEVADAAIAAFPKRPGYFLAAKVSSALARGDVKTARARLAALPPGWDPSGITSVLQVEVAFADRNYPEMAQLAATRKQENVIAEIQVAISFMEGMAARRAGDLAKAQSIFTTMRKQVETDSQNRPEDVDLLSRLAKIRAYLGDKGEALQLAEKAVALKPISRDAVAGPGAVEALAEVCMVTGDHDRAIELLSQIAKVPYGPSYGELLGPEWDDLRGDRRFETIVASLKPNDNAAR